MINVIVTILRGMQWISIGGNYIYNEILSILFFCEIKCQLKCFQCDLYSKLQLLCYAKITPQKCTARMNYRKEKSLITS